MGYRIWLSTILFGVVICSLLPPHVSAKLIARYNAIDITAEISDNRFKETTRKKITINTKRGEWYAKLSFWENQFSSIKKIELVVRDKQGNIYYKKSKKDFGKADGYDGVSLYSDETVYYFDAVTPKLPYVVEYTVIKEYNSLFFWTGAVMQYYIPVDSFTYTLVTPPDFSYKHKLYHTDCTPEITEGNSITKVWNLTDIPLLPDVDNIPASAVQRAKILFVADNISIDGTKLNSSSWKGVGQWYEDLARDKYIIDETQPFIHDIEGIKRVYNEVINTCRYVAIQIGIGGWQPYDAATVEKRAYGDCKDLTTLLVSRLRSADISAFPVLVRTSDKTPVDSTFPSPSFNHVITMAVFNKDTIWMDPTCNECPFGEIPGGDEDILVLVVNDSNSQLVRTPRSGPDQNYTRRKTTLRIRDNHTISFATDLAAGGVENRRFRYLCTGKTDDELRQVIDNIYPNTGYRFKINEFKNNTSSNIYTPFLMSTSGSVTKGIDKVGSKLYLRPFIYSSLDAIEKLQVNSRVFPVEVGSPYASIDSVFIQIDTGLKVDSLVLPESIEHNTSFGRFTVSYTEVENGIWAVCHKNYTVNSIPVSAFEEFAVFIKKIKMLSKSYIKLYTG